MLMRVLTPCLSLSRLSSRFCQRCVYVRPHTSTSLYKNCLWCLLLLCPERFVRKLVVVKGKKWLSAWVPGCIFHQRKSGRKLPSSCRILQYISGHFWSGIKFSSWHAIFPSLLSSLPPRKRVMTESGSAIGGLAGWARKPLVICKAYQQHTLIRIF